MLVKYSDLEVTRDINAQTPEIQQPEVSSQGIDIPYGQGFAFGTSYVLNNELDSARDRAHSFTRDFKRNISQQNHSSKAPKAYSGFGTIPINATLAGKDFNMTDQVLPISIGFGGSLASGTIPVAGVPLAQHPYSFRAPVKAGTALLMAAAADTGADVGNGLYDNFYREHQEQYHKSPEYRDFWNKAVNDTSNTVHNTLDIFDPIGIRAYGKNWNERKQAWSDRVGAETIAPVMAHSDLIRAQYTHPLDFLGTAANEVYSQPGKWYNWAADSLDLGYHLARPAYKALTTPQTYHYLPPVAVQNFQDAFGIPDVLYSSAKEPKTIDFSGYGPRLIEAYASGDMDAVRNILLSAYENRAAVKNADTFNYVVPSLWKHINNTVLNPVNWGKEIPFPEDPSLGQTPKARFNKLMGDLRAVEDVTAPFMVDYYNSGRVVGEGQLSDIAARTLSATWESLSDSERQKVRERYPDIDTLIQDLPNKVEANMGTVLDLGNGVVQEAQDSYNKKRESQGHLEGPSISAPSRGWYGIASHPKEERYFDWNNPDYRWPKYYDGYLENIPGAPAVNSTLAIPLALVRDSFNLAGDRMRSTVKSVVPTLRQSIDRLISNNSEPVVKPTRSNTSVVDEKQPGGELIRHDWHYGRNAPSQVF